MDSHSIDTRTQDWFPHNHALRTTESSIPTGVVGYVGLEPVVDVVVVVVEYVWPFLRWN
jgi:hypothetical protein